MLTLFLRTTVQYFLRLLAEGILRSQNQLVGNLTTLVVVVYFFIINQSAART